MNANVLERTTPYTLNGRTYYLKATWNVEAEVQDRFGSVKAVLEKKEKLFKNLLSVLTILINEAIDIHNETSNEQWEFVTEKYVGRHIDMSDPLKILYLITDVFIRSSPESEKNRDEDFDDPNKKTQQE